MDEGQAVDEDAHVIAVVIARAGVLADGDLVDHLQVIVVDVLAVDQGDVLAGAVVADEHLHVVLLDFAGLLHDVLIRVGDGGREKALPLLVGEVVVVQLLQLDAQVGDQLLLGVDRLVLIALFGEQAHELPLQLRLGLVGFRAPGRGFVGSDDGVFAGLGDDVERGHRLLPQNELVKFRSCQKGNILAIQDLNTDPNPHMNNRDLYYRMIPQVHLNSHTHSRHQTQA